MKFPPFPFTVLDTETTGLIPRVHSVIEFASVRIENGKIVDEYTQLLSIAQELPPVTQTLTRIRSTDLAHQPAFRDAQAHIRSHIGDNTIIFGQNVGFDIAMLKGSGFDLTDRPWIDTSMISSLVFPELDSYSLGYVSAVLGLHHEPVHRALGDVHATLDLIERCWARLQEVPEELLKIARKIGEKSTPAYRTFFSAIPNSSKKKRPMWLTVPSSRCHGSTTLTMTPDYNNITKQSVTPSVVEGSRIKIQKPDVGVVDLIEEPLEPSFLQRVINACSEDANTVHWIAVKNLEHMIRHLDIPEHARILWPPFLLPDRNAVTEFANQPSFTPDEATLAIKLAWYEPQTRGDLPIHGNERFVWNGKIACTDSSSEYISQFADLPHTLIIDHRQLMAFLADPEHAAHKALTAQTHIIIDDASILEETATKAYGWSLNLDDLRAGVTGDDMLTAWSDVFQLWIEKTRGTKDTYVFTPNDFSTPTVRNLKEQLIQIGSRAFSSQRSSMMKNIQHLFDNDPSSKHIVWIDTRQDGGQVIHSVPECIDTILSTSLYQKFPTTLLIPPKSATHLREILPPNITSHVHPKHTTSVLCSLSFTSPDTVHTVLTTPPHGKTVILMPGKQAIERAFVTYAESLEHRCCTLFCQGFSGGQGRFQSEFGAESGRAILLITPWIFEGLELPPENLDRLIIATLPFDNPLYPTIARRSLHYQDSFSDYSLPRLEQRLFRIIRTFCRFAKEGGEVTVTDERLEKKAYGKTIKTYLRSLVGPPLEKKGQMELPLP